MDKQIEYLESKIISKKNRFLITDSEKREIRNIFKNSNVFITGAAGSIGKHFVMNLLKINSKIKNLYLMDKNENDLTELNRNILLNKNSTRKIYYICSELNCFNLNNFLKEKKINIFLNFAAVKHVRSEENIFSIKYLFLTNSINCLHFKPSKYLRKIFIISTDKAADPSSLMGFSKKIMEYKLFEKFNKNKKVSFSTIRFGNVSFSNGSVLKLIFDRIGQKRSFGIPVNIDRYFLTHLEASFLCLHALLNRNNRRILVPKLKKINVQKNIYELLIQILNINKIKFKLRKNKLITKHFYVKLIRNSIIGQKSNETFVGKKEKLIEIKNDKCLNQIKHSPMFDFNKILKRILIERSSKKIRQKFLPKYSGKYLSENL